MVPDATQAACADDRVDARLTRGDKLRLVLTAYSRKVTTREKADLIVLSLASCHPSHRLPTRATGNWHSLTVVVIDQIIFVTILYA